MSILLNVKDLNVSYGDLQILHDINMKVNKHEIVTVIGANGAGKTTLLKTIAGLIKPREGEIFYQEIKLKSLPPHKIAEIGITYVPEGRRPFPYLTVEENLKLGAYTKRARMRINENLEFVFNLFPILKERRGQLAYSLSGGEQQMLAIGRALMSSPELIMFDEPSLGLAPKIVDMIFDIIKKINQEEGITILLVEQNAHIALELADRGYVLETGRIVLEGESIELKNNDQVRKAYLGI